MDNKRLTLGSLFDGSGGFPLAGILSGIRPVWSSEIEPFPIRVTTKRLPRVKHYGDVSVLDGSTLEPVDIITFGSPCQDLSVAGKRAGIHDGERSSLFFQAIRIVKEMREATNGKYPRYIVWENVEGARSSNCGEDFQAVLEAIIGIKEEGVQVPTPEKGRWPKADVLLGDGWSVAYRVFDSKYWGVPQRRARIYLVGDLAGERAGDILFKSEGLCGYSPESFGAWQEIARNTGERSAAAGGICLNDQGGGYMDVSMNVVGTLRAQDHGHLPAVLAAGFCTEHSAKARGIGYEEETSPTLRAGVVPAAIALEHHATDSRIKIDDSGSVQTLCRRMGTGGNNVPLVMEALSSEEEASSLVSDGEKSKDISAFGIGSFASEGMLSENPETGFYEADTSRTLDVRGGFPGCHQGGIAIVEKVYPIEGNGQRPSHKGDGWSDKDEMFTLNGTEQHAVAYAFDRVFHASKNSHLTTFTDDGVADTLVASEYKDPPVVAIEPYYIVRRLTPVECARLQAFPDWWCDNLGTDNPTDEEVEFWTDVFETHRRVITHASKPKTEKQIRKWLKDPYLDSAAYRMWGNGVTLSIPWYILSSIVYWSVIDRKTAQ